jgi:MarR family transcriptional regulator, transcriptional regulator for hemolysin
VRPTTNSYDRDLRLSYLIHDVSRLRRVTFDQLMKPLGATRAQWWVIAFLSRQDGMMQTQLANELDLGKASLGGLIDRLESGGWVARHLDPMDRRAKRVYITTKSRRLLRDMRRVDREFNAVMLKDISDADRDQMVELLSRIKNAILRFSNKSDVRNKVRRSASEDSQAERTTVNGIDLY